MGEEYVFEKPSMTVRPDNQLQNSELSLDVEYYQQWKIFSIELKVAFLKYKRGLFLCRYKGG